MNLEVIMASLCLTEIDAYNAAVGSKGGHAILQRFEGKLQSGPEDASDSNSDQESPKRNPANLSRLKGKHQWLWLFAHH